MSCDKSCPNLLETKSRAHCGSCHQTMSGVSAFDIHRVSGRCDTSKLVCRKGIWGHPGSRPREWS